MASNTAAERPRLYKIVVLGDGGVGKTCLTSRLCYQHFVETYDPTLEDSYRRQTVIDGQACMLEILDTAGQEEYTAMREQWIRDGDTFLLVFSLTSRKTLDGIDRLYRMMQQVKRDMGEQDSPPIVLVGNKCDLAKQREVTTKEGNDFAKKLNVDYLETSAKDGTNVDRAFFDVVRLSQRLEERRLSTAAKSQGESTSSLQRKQPGKWKIRLARFFRSSSK